MRARVCLILLVGPSWNDASIPTSILPFIRYTLPPFITRHTPRRIRPTPRTPQHQPARPGLHRPRHPRSPTLSPDPSPSRPPPCTPLATRGGIRRNGSRETLAEPVHPSPGEAQLLRRWSWLLAAPVSPPRSCWPRATALVHFRYTTFRCLGFVQPTPSAAANSNHGKRFPAPWLAAYMHGIYHRSPIGLPFCGHRLSLWRPAHLGRLPWPLLRPHPCLLPNLTFPLPSSRVCGALIVI